MLNNEQYGNIKAAFLELSDFVIYGVSSRAAECYEWLKRNKVDNKLVGFVGDNSGEFMGKPVYCAQNVPDINFKTLIMTERNINELYSDYKNHFDENRLYFFYTVRPYLGTEGKIYPEESIRALYNENDHETQMFLDNYFFARHNNWSLILPLNMAHLISPYSKKYWSKSDNDLSVFEEITFVDCGAYTGDSIESFYNDYGSAIKMVIAFEPDLLKEDILRENLKKLGLEDISTQIMSGVSDNSGLFGFENEGTTFGRIAHSSTPVVSTKKIDSLGLSYKGKLCIKMDIEGLELEALHGAKQTIEKYRPELAICIYHKAEDIFAIPRYIKKLVPSYNFIIRGGVHTVCYGYVERTV